MTKVGKAEKCRAILDKYSIGDYVNNEDFFFLFSVFENHIEWDKKRGEGVEDITVELTSYKNKCFVLHRVDGSTTDISFLKSLSNPSKNSQLKRACRGAILNEVMNYRSKNVVYGVTRCPITNEILTKENTHIDHYDLTFAEVYDKWIAVQNIPYLVSKLNETIDNNTETYFTDQRISNDFRIFHNWNTHLRAVTKDANLVILKKLYKQQKITETLKPKTMEAKGQFKAALAPVSGQGKNGEWRKQEFVIEIPDDKFPKKVCFSLWGDKTDKIQGLKVNQEIKVKFDVESREYNGRWFTECKAFEIEVGASGKTHAEIQSPELPGDEQDPPF